MALQWHPDKNPDNLQEAKLQFQLIQSAYDTLSDPQERAFYDRNRESILKGKASGEDRKPETMDLFAYFSTSCYSGFNDSEKGFYTVYRKIFDRIAAKDMEYMDDEEEFVIPNFGRSDTDLEDVSQFYGYWMSYCTQMSFAWADQYDVREAKSMGRWVEKKIEAENKKCRVKAKKEFNEEVRTLVAFAQKRDKRWKERKRQLEAKVAENRKKLESEQKRQREERLKLIEESQEKEKANMSAYEEQLREMEARFADEWGLSDSESDYNEDEYLEDLEEGDGDEDGGELEVEEGAEEEEIIYDDLFCVACNKSFKTDKAMESHERSKKHRESVSRLKAKMNAENELFLDGEDLEEHQLEQDEVDGSPDNSSKKKKQEAKADRKEFVEDDSEKENEAESEKENDPEKDDSLFRLYCAPCNKSFKTENAMEAHERAKKHRDIVSRIKASEIKENQKNDIEQVKSKAFKKKKNKNIKHSNDSDEENSQNEVNVDSTIHEDTNTEEEDDAQPKLKGKKAKDARKKARETNSSQVANGTEEKPSTCSVCKQEFPSRSKMFSHIKVTGHAALKNDPSVAATGKKGKKGKK